jgi:aspartyl-tRNA(Asn)/glutamyl-tRNA(Gln) amidotransferase subunit B
MSTVFETVIGIEVHAQLRTNTKLFCGCPNQFGTGPNSNVCPVCLGLPGALPVLNKQAVIFAVTAGLGLHCQIRETSVFSRKNYVYPDLPKGYQISQYDLPICEHGHLDIAVEGVSKRIGITRIHMEEDAGKLVHQGAEAISGSTGSLVDLNRACTPLIEIVSEPDIRSAQEARVYVENLRRILMFLGVCDGNMEEGSLRADANVSIRPVGAEKFGTRTEIKNVNSFRSLERAIESEVVRQTALILSGGTVIQETRHYDDFTQTTKRLRSKADAHDYRYFPEPDLFPLHVSSAWIAEIKATMKLHPDAVLLKYKTEGLSEFEIQVLLDDPEMACFFDACCVDGVSPTAVAKWVVGDLQAILRDKKISFSDSPVAPAALTRLVQMIEKGTLSGKMAKEMLPAMMTGKDPESMVKESGATQISDGDALRPLISAIIDQHPDVIEKVKSGKQNAADFLIGQVMKETKGRAKPDLVRTLILEDIQNR